MFFYILILLYILYLFFIHKNTYLSRLFIVRIFPFILIFIYLTKNIYLILISLMYIVYRILMYDFKYAHQKSFLNNEKNNILFEDSKKYLDIKVYNNIPYDVNSNSFIFLYSPHAIYANGFFYSIQYIRKVLNIEISPLVHTFFFYTPILYELFSNIGFSDNSYNNIDSLLKEKKNIILVPGGVSECIRTKDNYDTLYIKERKGIFKLAILNKTPIIPIVSSNESDFYRNIHLPIKNKYVQLFGKLFSYGKIFQPWIPYKNTIHISFGKPIYPIITNDIEKDILNLKERYIQEIKKIYMDMNKNINRLDIL